jgi:hypothetical protein
LDALSAMLHAGPPFKMHWTLRGHAVFPNALRRAVATCLLVQQRQRAASAKASVKAPEVAAADTDAVVAATGDARIEADALRAAPATGSRTSKGQPAALPPALWVCVCEFLGFNYSTPTPASGVDAAAALSGEEPLGSEGASVGSVGRNTAFRLSNVDEEGVEEGDDAAGEEASSRSHLLV